MTDTLTLIQSPNEYLNIFTMATLKSPHSKMLTLFGCRLMSNGYLLPRIQKLILRYWRGPENNAAHFLNYMPDEDIRDFYDEQSWLNYYDEEDADKEVAE
jgi:hypothetical protein